MADKLCTEAENNNERSINEISDQNQGGNEKKILDEKNVEDGESEGQG